MKCPYLKGKMCAHPKSVLSDGSVWITCKAVRALRYGCAMDDREDRKGEDDE